MTTLNMLTAPIVLPSLCAGTSLACTVHLDKSTVTFTKDAPILVGAVLGHPYAPLGGCQDDPVIRLVANELLRKGVIVVTFSFRGAGKSGGRTSWSAKPELDDYTSVAGFLTVFAAAILQHVRLSHTNSRAGQGNYGHLEVIWGGYSYGSLIASRVRSANTLYDEFLQAGSGSILRQLAEKAQRLASVFTSQHFSAEQGGFQTSYGRRESQELTRPRINTSYLLVSPLLPPLTNLLALSTWRLWSDSDQKQRLSEHSTLAVFGTNDLFTSRSKLVAWAQKISLIPGSKFLFREIENAGHFWHEHGAAEALRHVLDEWVNLVIVEVAG